MIKTNQNIQRLKPSATLAINQKVRELRQNGKKVFHFGFGQSPFPIRPPIVDALRNNAANNTYLPSLGLKALRNQIVHFLYEAQVLQAHCSVNPKQHKILILNSPNNPIGAVYTNKF